MRKVETSDFDFELNEDGSIELIHHTSYETWSGPYPEDCSYDITKEEVLKLYSMITEGMWNKAGFEDE